MRKWTDLLWLCGLLPGLVGSAVAQTANTFPASGNVGIGTTVPRTLANPGASPILDLSGGGYGPIITLHSTIDSNKEASLYNYSNGLYIDSDGAASAINNSIYFRTGNNNGSNNLITDMTILANGNVGIGTTNPGSLLQVGSTYSQNPSIMIGGQDSNNSSTGAYALLFGAFRDIENISSGIVATPTWTCCGGYPTSGYPGIRLNNLGFYPIYNPANPTAYSPSMQINTNGNVGIGTTAPAYKLHVVGQMYVSGGIVFPDGKVQNTAFDTTLCGGDYAESVDVTGDRSSYEPGDVLVLSSDVAADISKASEPYSTLVAGIYSTKPGVIGRRQTSDKAKSKTEIPMAMVGIVPTKVSAENGAIKRGDLLVTSATPGYAMKGTDRGRMLGAVIGKAVGVLESGTGVIEVLVSLQ